MTTPARAVVETWLDWKSPGLRTLREVDILTPDDLDRLVAAIDTAIVEEREACASFVETVEWKLPPADSYPMSRTRFTLALTNLFISLADAIRKRCGP